MRGEREQQRAWVMVTGCRTPGKQEDASQMMDSMNRSGCKSEGAEMI